MTFLNRSISKAHSLILILAIALIFEGFLIVVPEAWAQNYGTNTACECLVYADPCISPGLCSDDDECGASPYCVCGNSGCEFYKPL